MGIGRTTHDPSPAPERLRASTAHSARNPADCKSVVGRRCMISRVRAGRLFVVSLRALSTPGTDRKINAHGSPGVLTRALNEAPHT